MTVDPYEAERRRSLEEYERQDKRGKVFRVSDTDRERAVRQLRQHLADGRIDLEEFGERMDLIYGAKTNQDIDQALHQLPFVSVDPAVLSSPGPVERQGFAPSRPVGGGGSALAPHAAAFALASAAIFALTALVSLISSGPSAWSVVLLPMMMAWAAALLYHAIRERRHGG